MLEDYLGEDAKDLGPYEMTTESDEGMEENEEFTTGGYRTTDKDWLPEETTDVMETTRYEETSPFQTETEAMTTEANEFPTTDQMYDHETTEETDWGYWW